jgi:hypothetical protein
MKSIEDCEPLKKSWTKDTLILNLRQIIADVDEIHHIKSLPHHSEYDKAKSQMSDLVIMSMTP